MSRFDNPTVLVTRPHVASVRFVTALTAQAGKFQPLICPAFETIPLGADFPEFEVAVFTSQAAVAYAPAGLNRMAYCVGPATAQAAEAAGYQVVNGDGDVNELIKVILTDAPDKPLLHIRGEVSTVDVTAALTSQRLICSDIIAYRKKSQPIDPESITVIARSTDLIIPIFSGETVSILTGWGMDLSRAQVVVISPVVADMARHHGLSSITVAAKPNLLSMVAATSRLIA